MPSRTKKKLFRVLDLFCGAGGSAMGYWEAFSEAYGEDNVEIVGVDFDVQPRYPFVFKQGDAMEWTAEQFREFDLVHASPPCQGYTTLSNRYKGKGGVADSHPLLIAPLREKLIYSGTHYIIENVTGATKELHRPICLYGGTFGLGTDRPRLFECSFRPRSPARIKVEGVTIGVYGKMNGRKLFTRDDGTKVYAAANLDEASAAMGIDWMTWDELKEAVPPAYTKYLGEQFVEYVARQSASPGAKMKARMMAEGRA